MLLIIYNVEWNEDNWRQAREVIVHHKQSCTSHIARINNITFRILLFARAKTKTSETCQ